MRVLGLDPGSRYTGYGCLERHGERLRPIAHGRITLSPRSPIAERLLQLHTDLAEILERFSPDAVVLESLFHGVNSRSLIVLAQARGALLSSVAARGVAIYEYSPAEIKSAVTGNGRAGKTQVKRMVAMMLSLPAEDLTADSSDALAAAICYAHRCRMDQLAERTRADR